MIHGGICKYPAGSQLAQAVRFLKMHASQTQLVTIDIAANDLNPCVVLPTPAKILKCLDKVIPQAVTNLGKIMTGLRGADPSPGTIIGMSYYVPELAGWQQGTKAARALATASVALGKAFNKDLAGVYTKFGAPVANVFGAFKTSDFTNMVKTPAFGIVPSMSRRSAPTPGSAHRRRSGPMSTPTCSATASSRTRTSTPTSTGPRPIPARPRPGDRRRRLPGRRDLLLAARRVAGIGSAGRHAMLPGTSRGGSPARTRQEGGAGWWNGDRCHRRRWRRRPWVRWTR